jgi:hypothetical protein
MRYPQLFLLILLVLSPAHLAITQTTSEPCTLILKNGLYKTFTFARSSNFEQDLKTYFASDSFKEDFRNHRWGGDINVVVPIDGVPTPMGLSANANNDEINRFSQRVASATSLKVNQSFFDSALTSIPDVELAREYSDCLHQQFGLKPVIDVGENEVTISIIDKKEFDADVMPTVKNFAVVNGEVLMGNVQIGNRLGNNTTIIVKRLPDKDLVFALDTDKGAIDRRIPGTSPGLNKDLPIGTIIASYLTFDQFSGVTSNNINCPSGLFMARCSKWAPADGRTVPGSKLAGLQLPLEGTVPDLRGVFLRGLDEFDSAGSAPAQNDNRNDPEKSRRAGSYQADELKEHDHGFATSLNQTQVGPNSSSFGKNGGPGFRTSKEGGSETRPKNVAVYYYIRIN